MYYQECLLSSFHSCIEKIWLLESELPDSSLAEYNMTPNGLELVIINFRQANLKILFSDYSIPVHDACLFIQPFTPWKLCIEKGAGMVGVFFKAGSLRNILKTSINNIIGRVVALQNYFREELIRSFQKQLANALPDDRINLSMMFFSAHFFTSYSSTHLFPYILGLIHKHQGKIAVETLSAKIGISRQAVTRLFFDKTGMSPKYYCRLVHFNAVLCFLKKNPRTSWLDLTYRFDYCDQSHLIKDFYCFTGYSPKMYMLSSFVLSIV